MKPKHRIAVLLAPMFLLLHAQTRVSSDYEQCVGAVVDSFLGVRRSYISRYEFGLRPGGGLKGYARSGRTVLFVDESDEDAGLQVFANILADLVPGFATEKFDFILKVKQTCKYQPLPESAPASDTPVAPPPATTPPPARPNPAEEGEQQHLQSLLRQTSGSATDMIRALETHLAKYPDSPRKQELLRTLAKAAIQTKDQTRIAKYGEAALLKEPGDVAMLEAVCRALAMERAPAAAKSALEWARKLESLVREFAVEQPDAPSDRARHREEVDRMLGQALLYQAMANGTLGNHEAAASLARKSFDAYPASEPAAESGRWLALLGRAEDAVRAYAEAFVIPDSEAGDADRAAIRLRMGELYQKAKGSETGLGDIVLQAYDRTAALLAERKLALRQFDPNMGLTNPMEFTLTGVEGDKLPLQSLIGKVIVMDFWATWCGPCRVQHPLYEKVKARFKSRTDLVFVAVNNDEDRSVVKPFLEEQGWSTRVYFEDGLARTLRVSSIPTTIVFGKDGTIVSRMNGFDPESFVDSLVERIQAALGTAKEDQ